MTELTPHLTFALRGAVIIGAIGLGIWIAVPGVRPQAAGFLLGMVFSMINGWYLAMKAQQIALIAAKGLKKRTGIGFFARAVLAILAVAIAVQKEAFDVIFTIIGLIYCYAAFTVSGVLSLIKNKQL